MSSEIQKTFKDAAYQVVVNASYPDKAITAKQYGQLLIKSAGKKLPLELLYREVANHYLSTKGEYGKSGTYFKKELMSSFEQHHGASIDKLPPETQEEIKETANKFKNAALEFIARQGMNLA